MVRGTQIRFQSIQKTKIMSKKYTPTQYLVKMELLDEKETLKLSRYKINKRVEEVKIFNEIEQPAHEPDTRHICNTCRKQPSIQLSDSGYCYYCRTDNWKRADLDNLTYLPYEIGH